MGVLGKSGAPIRRPTPNFERKTAFEYFLNDSDTIVSFAGGIVLVPFDVVTYDAGANVSQPQHAYVAPLAGIYTIIAMITLQQIADGSVRSAASLVRNGAAGIATTNQIVRGGLQNDEHAHVIAKSVRLTKGDVLQIYVGLTLTAAPSCRIVGNIQGIDTYFSGHRLQAESRTILQ